MTTAAPPTLELRDIFAGYDGAWALSNVSLELPPGRLVGVIGPNGSGKSTLLRSILGLVPHREGVVRLDGAPIDRRRIAYVPQRELVDWSFPVTVGDEANAHREPDQREEQERHSAASDVVDQSIQHGQSPHGRRRSSAHSTCFAPAPNVRACRRPSPRSRPTSTPARSS